MVITEQQRTNTANLMAAYASMAAGEKAHATLARAAFDAFKNEDYSAAAEHLAKLPDSIHRKVAGTQIATHEKEFIPKIKAVCGHYW